MERAWPNAQTELDFTEKAESIRFFRKVGHFAFLGHIDMRYSGICFAYFGQMFTLLFSGSMLCFFRAYSFSVRGSIPGHRPGSDFFR